jgi:hypothetical protein
LIRNGSIHPLAAAVSVLGWACMSGCTGAPSADRTPKKTAEETRPTIAAITTASCSGRSCHGSLEPQPGQQIRQDEYTAWLTHDKHAHAYEVLFNERSKKIAAHLGIADGNAHEDLRCLSCHLTPFAAKDVSPTAPAFRAAWVEAEGAFGVGCTSCHGAAGEWISAHTLQKWRKLDAKAKHDRGMVPVREPEYLARACVGCHVGAPPGKEVPLTRDVNHDLIAAGHPRLNFELAVYMANLPPHWKEKDDKNEPHLWATGQMVSANAALELLAHRAEDPTRPWPEFAEYDCFACHHDLQGEKSWRQQPDLALTRPRGSLAWGTWYFSMPRLTAGKSLNALNQLEKTMRHPVPDRALVASQTGPAQRELQDLRTVAAEWKAGTNRQAGLEQSWDAVTQLALALDVLQPSARPALQDIHKALAFPRSFDSPREIDPREILKRLKDESLSRKRR